MPIRVACPACRKVLKAPDDAAGRDTKCPACGSLVTIPAADAPAAGAESAGDSPPRWPDYLGTGAAAAGGTALLATFVWLLGLLVAILLGALAVILAVVGLALAGSRRAGWVSPRAGLVLGLVALLVALVVHHQFGRSVDRAVAAAVHPITKTRPSPAGKARQRGKTIARAVFTAADDFVVDVWHNGEKVADDRREMVGETHGATSEKLNIEVKEGDWLVFNVANNRLRWGGAAYFAVAGVNDDGKPTFQSDPTDGRWSYCDDPAEVPEFIARPSYKADRAALPPANPWSSGDGEIQSRVPDWSGKPVWGRERTTWIKYVAPAAGTWKPPAQAQGTPGPSADGRSSRRRAEARRGSATSG